MSWPAKPRKLGSNYLGHLLSRVRANARWRACAIRGQAVSPYLQLVGGILTHTALISLKLSSRSMG